MAERLPAGAAPSLGLAGAPLESTDGPPAATLDAGPSGRRASLPAMIRAQALVELRLALRRGESVLITIIVPPAMLLFFGLVDLLPIPPDRRIDFLAPGVLALAVVSTAMVGTGIATAFERYYKVLKRFGASPLPRSGLLAAKIVSILALEAIQVALILGVAVGLLGWQPAIQTLPMVTALALGTAAFGGLGLLMAGTLRAEMTLAVANGLYLVFLLLGGIVFPIGHLGPWLAGVAGLLPAAALADTLRAALVADASAPLSSWLVLSLWAVAAPVVAALTFRWE